MLPTHINELNTTVQLHANSNRFKILKTISLNFSHLSHL